MIYYRNDGRPLYLDPKRLGRGGEGCIYEAKNVSSGVSHLCAKIYFPEHLSTNKQAKIRHIVDRPTISGSNSRFLLCLPNELLFDGRGNFAGFLMPKAFDESIQLYELATLNFRKNIGAAWLLKYDRKTVKGIENRMKICVNIAIAIHALHQTQSYVLVDFKPQNILVTIDGRVSIIDLDSIQIASGRDVLHSAKVATPEYTPKEGMTLSPSTSYISRNWDRFSLAVVFYEILLGIHPYAATAGGIYTDSNTIFDKIKENLFVHGSKSRYLTSIPVAHQKFHALPEQIKSLFIRSFDADPGQRPSAEEWGQSITAQLATHTSENQLTKQIQRPVPNPHIHDSIPPEDSGNKNTGLVAVILVLLSLIILGYIALTRTEKPSVLNIKNNISNDAQSVERPSPQFQRSIMSSHVDEILIPPAVSIMSVDLVDTLTILTMEYNNGSDLSNHNWLSISPYTYIEADGRKYLLLAADIPFAPEKRLLSSSNQTVRFQLAFPSIGSAEQFDLIECPDSSCFNFINVSVHNPQAASWVNESSGGVSTSLLFWTKTWDPDGYTVTINDTLKSVVTIFPVSDRYIPNCGEAGLAHFELGPGRYHFRIESLSKDAKKQQVLLEGMVDAMRGKCQKLEF